VKVVYILNGTDLCGGVRVIYRHIAILRERGIEAEVVSTTPPSDWAPESHALYRQVPALDPVVIGPADIAVGTIFFTVPVAMQIPGAVPFHFCQGYEGLYEPARDQWPAIEEVYRLPAKKLVVSPHLVDLIASRYGQKAYLIPQPFDASVFPPRTKPRTEDGTFRILLVGQWEVPVKGLAWAFEALRPLRNVLPGLTIVRLSQDAPKGELAAWPDAERHVMVPPARVPEIYQGIDLLLGASTEAEGFGLPVLEAMATGVPCVLTDIGAFRGIDGAQRASIRVPSGDSEALRAAVLRLAKDRALQESLGREGRAIASRFDERQTGDALVQAFEEALNERSTVDPKKGGLFSRLRLARLFS
jgi:glycosyltransferase involved in cell wall biosynthesis